MTISPLICRALMLINCRLYRGQSTGHDMTRVEGENTRLRHYLARLKRKSLCYSKSEKMLRYSIQLLIHYLKFADVPIPYQNQINHSRLSALAL